MGTLFKRFKTVDGQKIPSKNWYGKYRDENGKWKYQALRGDKGVSRQLLTKLEQEARDIRDNLVSPYRLHARKPLTDHLHGYLLELQARNNTPEYIDLTHSRICSILQGCKIRYIGELNATPISIWIGKLNLSPTTKGNYATAIRGFANWLWTDKRCQEHRLSNLKKCKVNDEFWHLRRALSNQEFRHFLQTTRSSKTVRIGQDWRFTGEDRFILYLLAAYTGLRASELASLTVSSFDLDIKSYVEIEAAYAKNRKNAIIPFSKFVSQHVQDWIDRHNLRKSDKLFPGGWAKKKLGAKFVQDDLEEAGIPYCLDERYFDFHALRGQYATIMARAGVPIQTVKELMRHSDINLTLKVYTDLNLEDMRKSVEKIPEIHLA